MTRAATSRHDTQHFINNYLFSRNNVPQLQGILQQFRQVAEFAESPPTSSSSSLSFFIAKLPLLFFFSFPQPGLASSFILLESLFLFIFFLELSRRTEYISCQQLAPKLPPLCQLGLLFSSKSYGCGGKSFVCADLFGSSCFSVRRAPPFFLRYVFSN